MGSKDCLDATVKKDAPTAIRNHTLVVQPLHGIRAREKSVHLFTVPVLLYEAQWAFIITES
jgi:hypothetical protein